MYCRLPSGEDGGDHNIKRLAACGHRNSEAKIFHDCIGQCRWLVSQPGLPRSKTKTSCFCKSYLYVS